MNNVITAEQKEKLYRAIELARNAGGCEYVYKGKPCCVIAQLASIEGITIDNMKEWGSKAIASIWFSGMISIRPLLVYPSYVLTLIQSAWDDTHNSFAEETRRANMKAIVDKYCE